MKPLNKKALLKSLLLSDFFILTTYKNFQHLHLPNNLKIIKNFQVHNSLNIAELLKNLKQFIRILLFILTKKAAHSLDINIESQEHVMLVTQFFEVYPLTLSLNLQNSVILAKSKSDTQLILGNSTEINSLKILERLFMNNTFIVNKINSKIENNRFGTYKIFNDLIDFKKFIFISIILHKILNKTL